MSGTNCPRSASANGLSNSAALLLGLPTSAVIPVRALLPHERNDCSPRQSITLPRAVPGVASTGRSLSDQRDSRAYREHGHGPAGCRWSASVAYRKGCRGGLGGIRKLTACKRRRASGGITTRCRRGRDLVDRG